MGGKNRFASAGRGRAWLLSSSAGAAYAVCAGLLLSLTLGLALLATGLRAQWLAGERAEFVAGQLNWQLSPAFAALARLDALPPGTDCGAQAQELAELVQRTSLVRFAAARGAGGVVCASRRGVVAEPFESGARLLPTGNGRMVPGLRLANAAGMLELDAGPLVAQLALAERESLKMSLQVGGEVLVASGEVRPLGAEPVGEASWLPSAPERIGVLAAPQWSALVWQALRTQWLALLLAAALGCGIAWGVRRGGGGRKATGWEIAEGIRQKEFFAHYQPIVTASNGECVGVEVLARWRHPVQGNVRSEVFIQTAIDAGLIVALTRYLLRRVAEELQQIVLPPGFMVGINISTEHLALPELLDDCRALVNLLRDKQAQLVLEISERAPLQEASGAQKVINGLRQMGVRLALDDFGAGYADKAYLSRWGFDYLKVEKGYVSALGQDSLKGNILDGLLLSSNEMGVQVIVKGVETQGQQSYLNVKGFEYLQGFYFGKPMTLNHFRQWLYSGIAESRGRPPGKTGGEG
ncbi:EAL domain-containing protein [Chromobacterium sp.]|uniref:EAL domain-containing protein n=1 Tax=Chromobacterium aquaticum TaxID=467180 RepID=A0ABV8ZYL4_9NEIS